MATAAELDLYRLAVEMADRVSARRTTANNFFLALHAAMVAAVGLVERADALSATGESVAPDPLPVVLAGVAGIFLAAAWWLALRSYRDLNTAKFAVIQELEKRLPAQIFTDEWKKLKSDEIKSWRERYAEQGTVERFIPFVFAGIYVVAIVAAFVR